MRIAEGAEKVEVPLPFVCSELLVITRVPFAERSTVCPVNADPPVKLRLPPFDVNDTVPWEAWIEQELAIFPAADKVTLPEGKLMPEGLVAAERVIATPD